MKVEVKSRALLLTSAFSLLTSLACGRETPLFTPPVITIASVRANGGRTIVTFDVKDDQSAIQRVEFSSDGQQWRAVFPADGIADSRQEHFDLSVDGALPERGLTLRAVDSMNNVETAHVDPPAAGR